MVNLILVCGQVKAGVQAIFGPSDPILGAHINSICDALDIPHLEARIDIDTRPTINPSTKNERPHTSQNSEEGSLVRNREFTINLHPTQSLVNNAIQDVMLFLNWTRVAIIYEKNHDLLKLRELMRTAGLEFYIRQADPSTYLTVLKEIKHKEIYNLIIDTRPENMVEFLNVVKNAIILNMLMRWMNEIGGDRFW